MKLTFLGTRALFTHCGSPLIRADAHELAAEPREMTAARGLNAAIATDGLELELG